MTEVAQASFIARLVVCAAMLTFAGCGTSPEEREFAARLTMFLDYCDEHAYTPGQGGEDAKAELERLFAEIPMPPAGVSWAPDAYQGAKNLRDGFRIAFKVIGDGTLTKLSPEVALTLRNGTKRVRQRIPKGCYP